MVAILDAFHAVFNARQTKAASPFKVERLQSGEAEKGRQ